MLSGGPEAPHPKPGPSWPIPKYRVDEAWLIEAFGPVGTEGILECYFGMPHEATFEG